MKALGARAIPIPGGIDTFHLKEEVEPSDTMTALDAVMSVDEERERLEKEAEDLNTALTSLTEAAERGETSFGGVDDDKKDIFVTPFINTTETRMSFNFNTETSAWSYTSA